MFSRVKMFTSSSDINVISFTIASRFRSIYVYNFIVTQNKLGRTIENLFFQNKSRAQGEIYMTPNQNYSAKALHSENEACHGGLEASV